MSRAPSGRRVAAAAVRIRRTSGGAVRPSAAPSSGSAVAAPSDAADDAPQQSESEGAAGRGRDVGEVAVAAEDGEGQHEQAERQPDDRRPRDPGGRPGALGAAEAASASPRRPRRSGWRRRSSGRAARRPSSAGPVSITGASSVLTAWRKPSVRRPPSRPTTPRIDASGVTSAMSRPATSTAAAAASAASPAATTPGTARWPMSSSESSPAWGSTRPMRSRSGSARGGGGGGGLLGAAAAGRLGGRVPAGSGRLGLGGSGPVGRGRLGLRRGRAAAGAGGRLGRRGRRLGVGDEEVLLARAAGRAELRAGADPLAAVGAIPRLGPCHLGSSAALRPLAAMGWYHFQTMDGGGAKRRLLATLCGGGVRPASRRARRRPRARRPGRPRSCSPSTPRARWRPTTAPARRRSRPPRTPPSTCSARCRPRPRSGCASSAAPSPRADRARVPRLEPRAADRPARPRAGRAADPLVQGEGPHPDRLRARARRRGPRDLGAADDHPRLRRQGHLPAALAVPGRPADREGRRRDAHPGDRLQRRQVGAARAAVHRQGGRRRLHRRRQRRHAEGAAARARPRARCASTCRGASRCAAARTRVRRPRWCPGATSTACSPTASAGTPSSCAAARR